MKDNRRRKERKQKEESKEISIRRKRKMMKWKEDGRWGEGNRKEGKADRNGGKKKNQDEKTGV